MTTKISVDNIQASALETIGAGPKISQILIGDSNYTTLDDTAVSLTGGYIKIIGTGFKTGATVTVDRTAAVSVTFVSATELHAQVGAKVAGSYIVYVVNTDGGVALRVNGLTYSSEPAWTTDSLPSSNSGTAISLQLVATGAVTFELQAGSTLPAGLTLSSGGLLSGTVTVETETIYNFTVVAIDAELQDSPRSFSITITAGDQYWNYVTLLLPGTTSTSIFNDDASTNNFPISIFGDTRPNNSNPYTPGYYSNLFDGNGDYLTFPNSSAFTFGTGDFTIEAWVNLSSTSSRSDLIGAAATGSFDIQLTVPTNLISFGRTNTAYDFQTTYAFVVGQWTHVAIARASGTIRCFVNGVLLNSAANTINYSQNGGTGSIGAANATEHFLNGYISNLRVVKGQALYTTTFTPSTTPLTTTSQGATASNVSLLTCQSNRFIDNSTNNFTITRNGDVTVNSFDPFVPSSSTATLGSTYFDGTGDYLSASGNTAFAMGTGNFTYEAWINPISISTYFPIVGQFSSLSTGGGFFLFPINSSRQIELYYDGQTYTTFSSATVILNTWNHVAIVRSGNTITGYINGVVAGTVSYSGIFGNSSTNLEIGGTTRSGGNLWANGYISNVRILKGTALYTAAFTPPTAPLTAIANTSLLTCQTNQPVENNDFLDSSTNNLIVTRNGNTTQGTFSPYAENWSNYFDGGTNRLTTAGSSAFNLTGTSLTLECWVYMTAAPSVVNRLFSIGPNAAQSSLGFGITPSRVLDVGVPFGSGGSVNSGSNLIPLNTWTHLAFVLSGSTGTIYINGTQVGQSSSWNITSSNSNYFYIGYDTTATVDGKYTGYVSNVRLVRGTAVYSGTFTPSTTPLQPIAGTSILTCRDSSFVDDSANRFTVTSNGNVSVQKFGPFAGTTLPTPYYGAYFDGNGDYLSVADNAALQFGTGDFTVETWIYVTTLATAQSIFEQRASGASFVTFVFYVATNGKLSFYVNPSPDIAFDLTVTTNSWNHVALVRQSGVMYCYLNGVKASNSAAWTGNNTTSINRIGQAYSGADFNGYMSNFRIVKGTAVYTANFTPPTAPLTAIAGTSLLTCQSNRFIDNSTNNFAITAVGNSQPTFFNPFTITYSTLQSYSPSVFGGSMYFDGTGDFLTVPDNTTLQMSTGDFTIEFWINFSSIASYQTPYDKGYTNAGGLVFQTGNGNGRMIIYASGSAVITESGTGSVGEWIHYALVRRGTTLTLYRNGTSSGTATNSTNFNNSSQLGIGANGVAPGGGSIGMYAINGYLSNVRVVKGTALYTSNFVPSNQPLTAVQNSVLLLNGTAGGIIDVSSGNNLETVADTKLSVVQSKWSSTSMFFDGTGDMLVGNGIASSGAYDRLTVSGVVNTVECWVYLNALSSPRGCICGSWSSNAGWTYDITTGGDIFIAVDGAGFTVSLSTKITTGAWLHLAFVNNGTNINIYLNGINVGTQAVMGPSSYIGPITIGMRSDSQLPLNGYMNDFRITRAARYTANFTPPTGPFVTN